MPITEAIRIVERMEDCRRIRHIRRRDVELQVQKIAKLKEDLKAAEEYLPELKNRAQEAEVNFNAAVANYARAGERWLKIEAVDAPDDIARQQPPVAFNPMDC